MLVNISRVIRAVAKITNDRLTRLNILIDFITMVGSNTFCGGVFLFFDVTGGYKSRQFNCTENIAYGYRPKGCSQFHKTKFLEIPIIAIRATVNRRVEVHSASFLLLCDC